MPFLCAVKYLCDFCLWANLCYFGFSNKYLEKLRKIGRKIVLPSDEIKGIVESRINFEHVKSVCDFGAGSLFWSEYFAEKLNADSAIGGGA